MSIANRTSETKYLISELQSKVNAAHTKNLQIYAHEIDITNTHTHIAKQLLH